MFCGRVWFSKLPLTFTHLLSVRYDSLDDLIPSLRICNLSCIYVYIPYVVLICVSPPCIHLTVSTLNPLYTPHVYVSLYVCSFNFMSPLCMSPPCMSPPYMSPPCMSLPYVCSFKRMSPLYIYPLRVYVPPYICFFMCMFPLCRCPSVCLFVQAYIPFACESLRVYFSLYV